MAAPLSAALRRRHKPTTLLSLVLAPTAPRAPFHVRQAILEPPLLLLARPARRGRPAQVAPFATAVPLSPARAILSAAARPLMARLTP